MTSDHFAVNASHPYWARVAVGIPDDVRERGPIEGGGAAESGVIRRYVSVGWQL